MKNKWKRTDKNFKITSSSRFRKLKIKSESWKDRLSPACLRKVKTSRKIRSKFKIWKNSSKNKRKNTRKNRKTIRSSLRSTKNKIRNWKIDYKNLNKILKDNPNHPLKITSLQPIHKGNHRTTFPMQGRALQTTISQNLKFKTKIFPPAKLKWTNHPKSFNKTKKKTIRIKTSKRQFHSIKQANNRKNHCLLIQAKIAKNCPLIDQKISLKTIILTTITYRLLRYKIKIIMTVQRQ